jgi:hypothetical protein
VIEDEMNFEKDNPVYHDEPESDADINAYRLAALLVAKQIVDNVAGYSGLNKNEVLSKFTKTDMFEDLMHIENRMWHESPMCYVDEILSTGMLGIKKMKYNSDSNTYEYCEG